MAFRLIRETNDYSFLNAKVQARRGLLLTTNDYEHLLSVDLEEGISYLKPLPRYQGYFEKVDYISSKLSLILEKILKETVYTEMQFLVQFAPSDAQDFFFFYMKKPYLKVLEFIIQDIHKSPIEPLDLTNMFIPSPDEKIELELASKALNMEELITHISSEWLQEAIRTSLTNYRKTANVFDIIYNIERDFYINLWEKIIVNLKRSSRSIAEKVIGIEIDLNNISRIIRKKAMQAEPASIRELLIPFYFKLNMNIDDLINTTSLSRALSVLDSTYSELARALRRSNMERKSMEMLEQIQQEYFLRSLTGIMAGVPFHLGILLSYYLYRLQEVENLRIIFESKIKEVDLDFTRNLLIYFR